MNSNVNHFVNLIDFFLFSMDLNKSSDESPRAGGSL